MPKISTVSFRVNVAGSTAATVPVSVDLSPIGEVLRSLMIFATSTPDMSKSGFRVRNHGKLILPDNGSSEAGLTLGAGEGGWSPLPASPMEIYFSGYPLEGPPYAVSIEFYNTAAGAVLVGGFLHACEREYSAGDLVKEIKRWMEQKPQVIEYSREVDIDKGSRLPPGPVQRVEKK